ncbi:MAG: cysteine desulfurase [Muribaculaceae bacterium]|nr:cysteine desulfurase [Muribaculaceae bacterium]
MNMEKFDVNRLREEFPILSRDVAGKPMVYLDNGATSQTPRRVVEEIMRIYTHTKANVHRGVHTLSQEMTDMQERTREKIRGYINAGSIEEVIFTRGTTEGINLVASSFGSRFKKGDEIILTVMEHHANIVPWQLLRDRTGIVIRVVDINDKGELDLDQYRSLFNERTVMASFCHVSNVLGTVNPVKEMVEYAHSRNVPVLIDGAQASPHMYIDMQDIDCDFYVFSSHKMYGPTGIGVLYGKKKWLEEMPPYQGGGEMIGKVTFEHTTYADLPFKFEAGTPDFVDIAALSKGIDFIEEVGMENIAAHERELLDYTQKKMVEIPGLKIYGTADHKDAVISFLVGNIHPYDLGLLLDKQGVEVRTGHHCAMPLMDRLGIPGTVRVSFAAYNTIEEADAFINALKKAVAILG